MKNKKLLIGVLIILVIGCICIATIGYIASRESSNDEDSGNGLTRTLKPLASACLGDGVPEAAAYFQSSGLHPVNFMSQTEEGDYLFYGSTSISEWRSPYLEEQELVVCIHNLVEQEIELCEYTLDQGGKASISRIRINGTFRLVEAQSGKEIFSDKVTADPRFCADEESFVDGTAHFEIKGTLLESIVPLIQSYVEIP